MRLPVRRRWRGQRQRRGDGRVQDGRRLGPVMASGGHDTRGRGGTGVRDSDGRAGRAVRVLRVVVAVAVQLAVTVYLKRSQTWYIRTEDMVTEVRLAGTVQN